MCEIINHFQIHNLQSFRDSGLMINIFLTSLSIHVKFFFLANLNKCGTHNIDKLFGIGWLMLLTEWVCLQKRSTCWALYIDGSRIPEGGPSLNCEGEISQNVKCNIWEHIRMIYLLAILDFPQINYRPCFLSIEQGNLSWGVKHWIFLWLHHHIYIYI